MFIKNFMSINVSPEEWAERYNLTIKEYPCADCGKILTTNTPFFTQEMKGLYSQPCNCGNCRTPLIFTLTKINDTI